MTFDKIDSFHKIKVLCLTSMNPTWVKLRLTQAGYLHRRTANLASVHMFTIHLR